MQLTIEIKESALDKILYFLDHLSDDVRIVRQNNEPFELEAISEDDPDYRLAMEAKKRRDAGETVHDLDDIIKEFE